MSYPYISGPGNIAQMVNHLRKSFPNEVNADTVKKLGLASNNESYVINALQFVGVLDEESKKTSTASEVFSQHADDSFASAFGKMVKTAYSGLFELHSDQAWGLSKEELITYFRQTDQTSDAIGGRQAATFIVFSTLAGQRVAKIEKTKNSAAKTPKQKMTASKTRSTSKVENAKLNIREKAEFRSSFGLSVKVEINLPSDASAETYDNIFKSIRKNLLDE